MRHRSDLTLAGVLSLGTELMIANAPAPSDGQFPLPESGGDGGCEEAALAILEVPTVKAALDAYSQKDKPPGYGLYLPRGVAHPTTLMNESDKRLAMA